MAETRIHPTSASIERLPDQLLKVDQAARYAAVINMVASGLMDEGDPEFREQVTAQKLRRDETGRQIEEMRRQLASGAPIITPEKIEAVARLLKDKLHNGPPDLRQAYARLMIDEVRVTKEEIRICGSKSVLARAASEGVDVPAPAVLSFVQEWRARHDSNVRPLPSEGSTLSS